MKRLEEVSKIDDPNYCKYHQLISHPIEKYFLLKDKIMKLYENGDVVFNDETMTSNLVAVVTLIHHSNSMLTTIRFRSFEPVEVGVTTLSLVKIIDS